MSHWLVITVQGEEWEVEHEEECPTEVWTTDPLGNEITFHSCNVGIEIQNAGLDSLPDWKDLPEGRYPLSHHVEHTPSLPTNDGEEWDAWLEVGEREGDCDGSPTCTAEEHVEGCVAGWSG